MNEWNQAIEKAVEEVECVDWILPLQPEKRVNDFAKEAAKIVIGQCARAVRALARPAGDVEVGERAIDLLAKALAGAELNYRNAYGSFGASDSRTTRAWDKMRKAGDAIREHFYQAEECADAINQSSVRTEDGLIK